MNTQNEYIIETVRGLLKSRDNNCIVFLDETIDSDKIGRYISALANQAVLYSCPYAYALWGFDPKTRITVGTTYSIDQDSFIPFLSTNAVFSFQTIDYEDKRIAVLEVQQATETTIQYKGNEYILDENRPEKLGKFQDREKQIWRHLDTPITFEEKPAMENVSLENLLKLLDCNKLFELLNLSYPKSTMGVINALLNLRFVKEQNTGKYTITNLGALLLAKRLSYFNTVQFKAVRVIKYDGLDVTQPAHEQVGGKGYLIGFEGLIDYIMKSLPKHEVIEGALRKTVSDYPLLSIRELVANALIHQDLTINGCPIISIFSNRIEITNPGIPLVPIDRFIDTPPCSRNELLASVMRKTGICEERGSGYDKVVSFVEQYNLPAPQIIVYENHTKVVLSARKSFDELTKDERIWACYYHTCLNYVQKKVTNNTSLRLRFKLDENERYKVSRVFSDSVAYVKPKEGTGPKNREYLPIWAE
ncbi:ATP-binding protein [Anaerotruncus colihominis]|uniref:ATP-binding protein n=1 Tax=Anaerotruncus colihominis TaxID=169435 RepID=UPI00189AA255|nr:transcriptional regulator [Eubacterium limosum]